ncbi:MFS transporter [Luminiphilus sp.]|jgi:predicted MFS family arabinose efflux permease|nr:MFS transporter [Luminiphilus sp.]
MIMTRSEAELAQRWPLIMATCIGIVSSSFVLPYYSIGALLTPVTEEFGWSRAQFQAAILFSSGLGALTSPLIGWLNDKYGPRRVALPSMIGLSLGLFTASQIQGQLWMLFLAYGMMALLGAGTIPVTWTRAIATSFFKRRGLALGLALTGTGICASIAPHYTVWLTDHYGWRGAYVGLALVPLVLAWPMLYFLFKPLDTHCDAELEEPDTKAALENGLTLGEAVKGYRFWILLLSILFAYQGFSGIGPNLLPSLTDDGFSRDQAASVQSVFGISIIVGRVVVGYLVDRFWAPGVAAFCLAIPAAGAAMLHGSQTFETAALAAFLIGFAAGAELDLMAFLAARYFGLAHYAKIYSILYATLAVCSGTAPMIFASVYDATGSYDLGYSVASVLFLVSVVLILMLGRYPKEFAAGH